MRLGSRREAAGAPLSKPAEYSLWSLIVRSFINKQEDRFRPIYKRTLPHQTLDYVGIQHKLFTLLHRDRSDHRKKAIGSHVSRNLCGSIEQRGQSTNFSLAKWWLRLEQTMTGFIEQNDVEKEH
jgi:hypothetical protein